ncbi:MAG: acyl-CoA dehydrogenase family protein [Bdellovibrionales bacterium]|nr:acyl-CoA dehydrogenase family protein [Bdellovibrionales bacterium]
MSNTDFFQKGPSLSNQFNDDDLFKNYLKLTLPSPLHKKIFKDLETLGERVISDVLKMADEAERIEPVHIPYDAWGNRIDEIRVSHGWKNLDAFSATEGMVAIGYEREFKEFSRLYQFSKLYLFNPSSALYTCPLAMTDGAARALELFADEQLKERAFKRLTSRDPQQFWTSGQWMTEKTGGSDVGRTETIARWEEGEFRLYGVKWFTSSLVSQMAMALARIEDNGKSLPGSRGLSLFYLETRNEEGNYNHLEVMRLKDKLGTRALPTAEIKLNGTKGTLVGKPGEGVKNISRLFNITRIYNANTSVAFSRRIIALAKDYATKREAFGKKLIDHPLHQRTIRECEHLWSGCFLFSFFTLELLGKEECLIATDDEIKILRLLTPLVKLYTARQNLAITSELVESFGGAGYVEDSGIAKWLRDAQVLTIWEGTTNVLSLDMLRAIAKENALKSYILYFEKEVQTLQSFDLNQRWEYVKSKFDQSFALPQDQLEAEARVLALLLSELTCHILVEKYKDILPQAGTLEFWRKKNI